MNCIIHTEVNIYQCENTTEAELLETVLGPGRLFLGETQTIKRCCCSAERTGIYPSCAQILRVDSLTNRHRSSAGGAAGHPSTSSAQITAEMFTLSTLLQRHHCGLHRCSPSLRFIRQAEEWAGLCHDFRGCLH